MQDLKIYDNIVKAAKQQGLSINSIEKEADLGVGSICKWNTVSPSVRSLMKVSNILGIKIGTLVGE